MPPRRAKPQTKGVTTRRGAQAMVCKSADTTDLKRPRDVDSSTDDSDIEVALEDSTSQAEPDPLDGAESAHEEINQDSGLESDASGPPESSGRLESCEDLIEFLRSRLLNSRSEAARCMQIRPKLQEVYDKLLDLLGSTAETPGSNHSFLLIGSRGTGKSLVVQRVLTDLESKYNTEQNAPMLGTVQLTGLAHTEDVVAFKEIARQLCRAFNLKYSKAASLAENLAFLRDILQELGKAHKVVIFVLDDLDLFARKAKQTTLYNLLDAVQTAGMQAAVVGLSCRHDVMELLEKRVRSRFSHRKHLLPDLQQDLQAPGNSPADLLASMLSVPSDMPSQAREGLHSVQNSAVQKWNATVADVLEDEVVQEQLQLMLNQGYGKPRDLADAATDAILSLSSQPGLLHLDAVLDGIAAVRQVHSKQAEVVGACSILELFILVSMYRMKRNGHESINFEMAFEEYNRLVEQGHSVDKRNRAAALRAFERLLGSLLISYVDVKAEEKGGLREFHAARVNVVLKEIEEGLKMHKSCPSLLKNALAHEVIRGAYAIA